MEKNKIVFPNSAMARSVIDNIVKPASEEKQLATIRELGKVRGNLELTHETTSIQLSAKNMLEVVVSLSGSFNKAIRRAAKEELKRIEEQTPKEGLFKALVTKVKQVLHPRYRIHDGPPRIFSEWIRLERSMMLPRGQATLLGELAEPLRKALEENPSGHISLILHPQIEINTGSAAVLSMLADPAYEDRFTLRQKKAKSAVNYIVDGASNFSIESLIETGPPRAGLYLRKATTGHDKEIASLVDERFSRDMQTSISITISELLKLPPLSPKDVGTSKPGFVKRDPVTGKLEPLNGAELAALRAACRIGVSPAAD